jgi:hypothetical protein
MSDSKVGWSVKEWRQAVGISAPTVYGLINGGRIEAAKIGTRTIIRTSPREFIAGLPVGIGTPPVGAPRRVLA